MNYHVHPFVIILTTISSGTTTTTGISGVVELFSYLGVALDASHHLRDDVIPDGMPALRHQEPVLDLTATMMVDHIGQGLRLISSSCSSSSS